MTNLFFYRREIKRKVPLTTPVEGTEEVIKGPVTEVVETYWDCFNINKVIRGHWTSPEEFTVMLDDGHEQTDAVDTPVFGKAGKIVRVDKVKQRDWYMSQIPLCKQDALRFRAMTERVKGQSDPEIML